MNVNYIIKGNFLSPKLTRYLFIGIFILTLALLISIYTSLESAKHYQSEPDFILQENDIVEIPLNKHSQDTSVLFPILKGFSPVENWGVWSNSHNVEIIFPMFTNGPTNITLCGGVLKPNQLQNSTLQIDAENKVSLKLNRHGCMVTTVNRFKGKIYLKNIQLLKPVDIGLSADNRSLGISLRTITFSAQ